MSLADITDFNEALTLLGLYEREVMITGVMEYVVPPKAPVGAPKETPKPIAQQPQEQTLPPTPPEATTPQAEAPPASAAHNTTINEGVIIINESNSGPPSDSQAAKPSDKPSPVEDSGPSKLDLLLKQQEMEQRLFYLFVDEVEQSGDLGKLPVAIMLPKN